jgi:hypothetical protein
MHRFLYFFIQLKFTISICYYRYHDNLMNMETTHPGITQDFDDGIISIRRTSKPFSASAIDLTLEQTQNKDAANSSTGKPLI